MNALIEFIKLLPFEWAQYEFMILAFLGIFIIAPIYSLIGCFIIHKQMSFFSDAVGHSVLTGVALGTLLGLSSPLPSMLVYSIFLAIIITFLKYKTPIPNDTLIGLVMAFSVALGIVILTNQGQFNKFTNILIGDILSLNRNDILLMLSAYIPLFILFIFFLNPLALISLHPALAETRGIKKLSTEMLLTIIIALLVALSIQWIGMLVINAIFILPASISRNISLNYRSYLWYSILIGLLASLSGLLISFYLSAAAGATIVLLLIVFFLFSLFLRKLFVSLN